MSTIKSIRSKCVKSPRAHSVGELYQITVDFTDANIFELMPAPEDPREQWYCLGMNYGLDQAHIITFYGASDTAELDQFTVATDSQLITSITNSAVTMGAVNEPFRAKLENTTGIISFWLTQSPYLALEKAGVLI